MYTYTRQFAKVLCLVPKQPQTNDALPFCGLDFLGGFDSTFFCSGGVSCWKVGGGAEEEGASLLCWFTVVVLCIVAFVCFSASCLDGDCFGSTEAEAAAAFCAGLATATAEGVGSAAGGGLEIVSDSPF